MSYTVVHLDEGCSGRPVVEFTDAEGDHVHCPRCGAWKIYPKA